MQLHLCIYLIWEGIIVSNLLVEATTNSKLTIHFLVKGLVGKNFDKLLLETDKTFLFAYGDHQ